MAAYKFPPKDPRDNVDETFDFTDFLGTDTITGAVITVDKTGLTVAAAQANGQVVSTRVSGGTDGETYTLTCEITTASGNTVNRSAKLAVKDL